MNQKPYEQILLKKVHRACRKHDIRLNQYFGCAPAIDPEGFRSPDQIASLITRGHPKPRQVPRSRSKHPALKGSRRG